MAPPFSSTAISLKQHPPPMVISASQYITGALFELPALKTLSVQPVVVTPVTATDIFPISLDVDVEFRHVITIGTLENALGNFTDMSLYELPGTVTCAVFPLWILPESSMSFFITAVNSFTVSTSLPPIIKFLLL